MSFCGIFSRTMTHTTKKVFPPQKGFKPHTGYVEYPVWNPYLGVVLFRSKRSFLLGLADSVHAEVHTFTEQVHASEVVRKVHTAVVINAERFSGCKSILIRS